MATINKIPKCPPLRFPDFNDDWKKTTLGEIAGLVQTRRKATTRYLSVESFLPNFGGVQFAHNETNNSGVAFEVDDVLMSNIRPYLRKVWRSNCSGACSSDVLVFRCGTQVISQFLYSIIANQAFIDHTMQGAKGVKMPRGDKQQMKSYPISLPSLAEQKKIADFLSLIDERIQSCSETIKELKTQKAGLLNQLFSQKLRFPDFNDEWRVTTLGEVLIKPQQKAVEDPTNTELITVKLHCKGIVNTGKYPNKTEKGRAYYIRYTGELLIGKQNFHNGGIGIVPHVCSGKICSNAIASYISKDQYIEYIYYYISRETYYSLFEKYLGGTGQKEISASEFNNLPISLPSLEEQKKIADFLSLIDERIEVEEQLLQQYEKQKRYLLKQMFV